MMSAHITSLWEVSEASAWVREGVRDAQVADHIFTHVVKVLEDPTDDEKLALGIHYLRGLGGRHLLSALCEALSACLSASSVMEANRKTEGEAEDEGITVETVGCDRSRCWLRRTNPLSAYLERASTRSLDDHLETPHERAQRRRYERDALRDGVSQFAELRDLYAHPTLAESALMLIAELAQPGHAARQVGSRYVSDHLSSPDVDPRQRAWLATWLWDHLDPRGTLEPLLPHARSCLSGHPRRIEALAVRLALLIPHEAISACEAMRSLSEAERALFSARLERQLKRVGRVKLWVQCRETLKAST